jgi:hypothetical protein
MKVSTGAFGAFGSLDGSASEEEDETPVETSVVEDTKKEAETVPVTSDAVLKKIRSFVEEYLMVGDITEAITCAGELGTTEFNHHIVFELVKEGVMKSEREHKRVSEVLVAFFKGDILTADNITTGFDEVMVEALDLYIDAPRLFDILGIFFAALIQEGAIAVNYLVSEYPQKLNAGRRKDKLGKLFIGLFRAYKTLTSEEELLKMLSDSPDFSFASTTLTRNDLDLRGFLCLESLLPTE